MSEMGQVVGAIRVAVVPDTTQFGADLQKEMQKSGSSLTDVYKKQAVSTAALAKEAEVLNVKYAVGLATVEQRDAAAKKFAIATLAEAQNNVRLAVSTGQVADAAEVDLVLKAKQIQETRLLEQETRRLGSTQRRQGELRSTLRNVASGEAPLSSLLSAGSIAKFGVAGLAIGTVFSALGHLEEALKVTGDEAFTTEGRFRNLGASLLQGDLVAGFQALNNEAPTATERLQDLIKAVEGLPAAAAAEKLQAFADKTAAAAKEARGAVSAVDKESSSFEILNAGLGRFVGGNNAMVDALKQTESQLRISSEMAQEYADEIKKAAKAEDDLRIAANQAAAAQSRAARTTGQADDLAEARRQETLARDALGKTPTNIGNPERAAAYVKVVEAHTKVLAIRKRIADENKRQDAEEARDAQTAAQSIVGRTPGRSDDLELAKQEEAKLRAAHASYKDIVLAHSAVIRIEQDIAAENKRADAEAKKIRDTDARDAQAARKKALAEAAARAKEDIDYRASLLDLEVQKAEDSGNKGREEAAYRKEIAFWEGRRKSLAKLGRAGRDGVVEAKKEIQQWQQKIKALKDDKGVAGAGPEDFFRAAVDTFREYGGGGSFLSAQDVRGDLAGRVLGVKTPTRAAPGRGASTGLGVEKMVSTYQEHGQAQSRRDASLLIETRRQTAILRRIASNTGRSMKSLQHATANSDKVKGA